MFVLVFAIGHFCVCYVCVLFHVFDVVVVVMIMSLLQSQSHTYTKKPLTHKV